MASQKQIDANRRNAQRSTGPNTPEGKSAAKFNSLKHGMTAVTAVLPHEDADSYSELRESFLDTYKPANAVEASLVETIANSYWRLLRARRVETAALDMGIRGLKKRHNASLAPIKDDDQSLVVVLNDNEDPMLNVERHQTKIERCYFKAIETLRKVQNDRRREERLNPPALVQEEEEIGFVLQDNSRVARVATQAHTSAVADEPAPTKPPTIGFVLQQNSAVSGIANEDAR
jgi:hypothetical protein